MRRRDKLANRTVGALPPELAIGRCIEVWSGHLPANAEFEPWFSAWRNWSTARQAFSRELPKRAVGAPWSIEDCDRNHGLAHADQRLRKAGVNRDDIPALRRAAHKRLADSGQEYQP
jgi:hypothetical protein